MSRVRRWLGYGAGVFAIGLLGLSATLAWAIATGDSALDYPGTPYPAIVASADPSVIEQGRYLAHGPAHCVQCHTTGDRDHPELMMSTPLHGGLAFDMGPIGLRYASNLTSDRETGLGAYTDGEIARTLRTGVRPNGELSMFMAMGNLSDEDLVALVSYLRSLAPVRNAVPDGEWYTLGKVLVHAIPLGPNAAPVPAHVPPADEPSVARGGYLVDHVMMCTFCHSEIDPMSGQVLGPPGGGGAPEPSHGPDRDMEFVTPNLTSHPTGVTGQLSEDAFVARIRAGRVHTSSIMPWEPFQQTVTDSDLRSVYRFLRTLPPIDHDVGPTYRKIGWTPEPS
jgi:mono/diheme cytochrome c family protein